MVLCSVGLLQSLASHSLCPCVRLQKRSYAVSNGPGTGGETQESGWCHSVAE